MVKYRVKIKGKEYIVEIKEKKGNTYVVSVDGEIFEVVTEEAPAEVAPLPTTPPQEAATAPVKPATAPAIPKPAPPVSGKTVSAPAPGKILEVRVKPGDRVVESSVIAVMESMKMTMEIYAGASGVVKEVRVSPGDFVELGQVIAVIE